MERRAHTLVLALGNDLLGDDGVGLEAARRIAGQVDDSVDVVETGEAGLALLELLEGYERALLIDSVVTGRYPPGTVLEFSPQDFRRVIAPSPHYAGLPEVLEMAHRLNLAFPQHIRILAMEVQDPYEFRTGFSEPVQEALPALVQRALTILSRWAHQQGVEKMML
ncbi:MAG: hydrogenase maturation protease [Armatimonadota bacterium]|nr:hydrogenase maturation protease [bacterium]MDW8320320.1 hydrogenase maturation protease [Armatimonadota bacterium]